MIVLFPNFPLLKVTLASLYNLEIFSSGRSRKCRKGVGPGPCKLNTGWFTEKSFYRQRKGGGEGVGAPKSPWTTHKSAFVQNALKNLHNH